MMTKTKLLAVLMAAACFMQGASTTTASSRFTWLGDLSGGEQFEIVDSAATGIAADGSVVTGVSIGVPISEPFIWTRDGGMQGLGFLNGPGTFTQATAISGNGAVVVGWGDRYNQSPPDQRMEPFRWTADQGMVRLGHLPGSLDSSATAVSFDGSVIVGYSRRQSAGTYQAFHWTPGGGMSVVGDLPGGLDNSVANGVSADGSVIAGYSSSTIGTQAYRWTQQTGMVGIGGLTTGNVSSHAIGLSADGSAIVGSSRSPRSIYGEAFLWTADGGMIGLGDLPGGLFESTAQAVTANGSIVVGESNVRDFGSTLDYEAFIWDRAHGMRRLQDILTQAGVDLTGWALRSATAITPDGRFVVGWGNKRPGFREAWIADISGIVPEPNALILAVTALLASAATRHRRRRRLAPPRPTLISPHAP